MRYMRTAIFRPRTGAGRNLRPGVEAYSGATLTVSYGWPITEEDRKDYAGETAWLIRHNHPLSQLAGWVASGDLEFVA